MGEELQIWGTTTAQVTLYYIFVLLAFLYSLYKYKSQPFLIFVILFFFTGLISAFGKNIFDIFKISLTILSLYWLVRYNALSFKTFRPFLFVSFFIFSLTFFLSAYLNGDYFSIVFSQYSRYFILLVVLLIFLKLRDNEIFSMKISKLLYFILLIQIVLSGIKLLIMGPRESLVGSITSQGGAAASILPILGFMFLWIRNKRMLVRKDWFFIIGLLFIGFVGSKRAIWFLMPIIIAAFLIYENRKKLAFKYILIGLIVAPLILYLGLKLSPTLNPENKIWGSFDLNFALNYADKYSYGDQEQPDVIVGRNSITNFIVTKFLEGDVGKEDWFGYGLRFMYATNYEEFSELGLYTEHKGSATGIFQTMVSNGYIGVLSTLLFAISMLWIIKNKRFRLILLLYFFWEYFYYTGSILREYSLSFLFIYIIAYADSLSIPVKLSRKSMNLT